jgi:hypothetical protein
MADRRDAPRSRAEDDSCVARRWNCLVRGIPSQRSERRLPTRLRSLRRSRAPPEAQNQIRAAALPRNSFSAGMNSPRTDLWAGRARSPYATAHPPEHGPDAPSLPEQDRPPRRDRRSDNPVVTSGCGNVERHVGVADVTGGCIRCAGRRLLPPMRTSVPTSLISPSGDRNCRCC